MQIQISDQCYIQLRWGSIFDMKMYSIKLRVKWLSFISIVKPTQFTDHCTYDILASLTEHNKSLLHK